MGVAWLWWRIELRRRWRRHLALALLVAVVVGPVLTCAAGARRTVSAFGRFANAQGLPDVELSGQLDHDRLESFGRLPGAIAAGTYIPFFAGPAGSALVPGQDFLVFAASDHSYGRIVDRPLLTAGRLPDPARADEVLANTKTAAQLHLHVGDTITLDALTPGQYAAISQGASADDITFDEGPHPVVRVVGIGVTRLDIGVSYASTYFLAGPAFAAQQATAIASYGELLDVRLRGGTRAVDAFADAAEAAAGPDAGFSKGATQDSLRSARDSAGVQGAALGLVGLLAALAGAVAIGQSIGRALTVDAADRQTLEALGLDGRATMRLVVATFTPTALLGAVLGVSAAWVASPLFPVGLARRVEVSPGHHLDRLILLGGGSVFVILVALRAAVGARRRPHTSDVVAPVSALLSRVARSLPSSEATGLRWALPQRGAARAAARAGLVGFVVSVVGLCAALSYGGGLRHLVSTPAAYGWTFDADAGGGQDPAAVSTLSDQLAKDPAIAELATLHVVPHAKVSGHTMQVMAFTPQRGSFAMSVVSGRAPTQDDEVLLGTASAQVLHVKVGGTVSLAAPAGALPLRVVGLGLFPNIETDSFASGAQVTDAVIGSIADDDSYDNVVGRWAPGTDVSATVARLSKSIVFGQLAAPPPSIANLAHVRHYPALLSGFVALLAVLSALHALVVSVRRRQRELGVLRAIGFTRRQVTRALVAHGVTVAAIGIVVGAPLGIALGRLLWRVHAERLHVAVVEDVPYAWLIGISLTGALVVALLAAAVGLFAVRRRPALSLRAD